MSELVEVFTEEREFFAPAATDLIDGLLAQYKHMRGKVDAVAGFVANDMATAIQYFMDGNEVNNRFHSIERMFELEGAIKALNASFWSKALNMTDVLQVMPQKRRDEWNDLISKMQAPEFEEDSVRATIQDLMLSRQKFFAEKVDGIFRSLSHEHVTNCPQGFSKRMILSGVTEGHYYTSGTQCGHINDLRAVIAKFMGRDEPRWNSTSALVNAARRNTGQWMLVDGGSMRIRVYLKGTAHLEIHPDMAWRLNQILASLYPLAIPDEFRTKPKKKHKEFQMMERPLPFAVIEILTGLRYDRTNKAYELPYSIGNEGAKEQAIQAIKVLEYIGGTKSLHGYVFDYDARSVLDEIIVSGCIPDHKTHQYYPTPESIAQVAIEMADIGLTDKCLEPSAGIGNLADFMPKARTYCVEISTLHSDVLRAKGYQVATMDFLQFTGSYDRIVMNPPFSEGRWQAHIQHASMMLNGGGVLVAILPASAKGKDVLPGVNVEWSEVFSNEFSGTSVSVVIMKAVAA